MIGCAPEHCLPLIICSALRNIFMFPRISYWEERMTIRRMNRLTYNKIISINTLHPQVPSECINYKKRPIAQYDGSFLVEVTGLAPLAARPGAQPTGLCSLLPRFLFPAPFANRSLPFAPPPSSPVRMLKLQKKTHRSIRWVFLVEVTGLEPTTFWSLTRRATKLRYTSIAQTAIIIILKIKQNAK